MYSHKTLQVLAASNSEFRRKASRAAAAAQVFSVFLFNWTQEMRENCAFGLHIMRV